MASIIEELPIEHPAAFGENSELTTRFQDMAIPEWHVGKFGPRFMQRPMPASRGRQYGPPFEVRPGPLPRQYAGIRRRIDMSSHPGIGGVLNNETTCGAWAAENGTACGNPGDACVDAGWLTGAFAGDVAKRCEEKCTTRIIDPNQTSAPTLIGELQAGAGQAIDKIGNTARDVVLSLSEFESLKRAYIDAKRMVAQLSTLPLPKTTAAKVNSLRVKEVVIDSALNNVVDQRGLSGLGIDPVTVGIVIGVAGGVTVAYFIISNIRAYLQETKGLTLCFDNAKKLPAMQQANAMAKCSENINSGKLPDWASGALIALGVGVAAYIGYRVYKAR